MAALVLLNISGADKPGLTTAITELLGDFDVDILDIGQAVIHNYLSLGMLVNIPGDANPIMKELLYRAHELGISVKFNPIDHANYKTWVDLQGQSRFILTLLARKIKAKYIAEITKIISANGLNIDSIVRLSGRVAIASEDAPSDIENNNFKASVEFSLKGTPANTTTLRAQLMAVCGELDIDIAFQEDTIFRRNRRLVAFDMDSTLITTEVIDELAYLAGVGDQVAEITERAMRGELDFKASLRQRVALLKGLPESSLETVALTLPLAEGAEHLFSMLNTLGYKTAILSGGFSYFAKTLQRRLGINYVHANGLEIVDGRLTGNLLGPIVDAARKADLIKALAEKENISLEQVIAVGDGANDIAMLAVAGLGIAFHAKPIVKENAEQSISNLGLDSILYLMGIRDRDSKGLS